MIKVYVIKIEYLNNNKLIEKILDDFSDDLKNKIIRFRKIEDKLRSMYSYLLFKYVTEKIYNIKDISINKNEYGKPYFNNSNIKFNISHSGEYVVLAIGNKELGIDVEKISNIDYQIFENTFSEKEFKFIISDEKNIYNNFFRVWTLKESYIKALGMGLSKSLKSFTFEINEKIIKIEDKNEKKEYIFKEFNIDKNYKFAVCGLEKIDEEIEILSLKDIYLSKR